MSKQAQRQRNLAHRQVNGHRRHVTLKAYTVKNTGTRKTVTLVSASAEHALQTALTGGLAKSLDKLVVVSVA